MKIILGIRWSLSFRPRRAARPPAGASRMRGRQRGGGDVDIGGGGRASNPDAQAARRRGAGRAGGGRTARGFAPWTPPKGGRPLDPRQGQRPLEPFTWRV